jgi:hypothetical protein
MDSHGEFVVGTPSKEDISLPPWETKTIKVASVDACNVNDSRNTKGQKQLANVALIAHVLEACDTNTYEDAHG